MQFEPTGGFPPIMLLNEIPKNNLNTRGFANPIATISNILNSSTYSNFLNFDQESKGGVDLELASSVMYQTPDKF